MVSGGGMPEANLGAASLVVGADQTTSAAVADRSSTRFEDTVMISFERPANHVRQVVEAIVEQLTTLPGSDVTLMLEILAEVPSGLDRSKVRTLLENAPHWGSSTRRFLDFDHR